MKLQSLFSWNEFPEKHIVDPDLEVTGLAFDSRKVGPGFVFFALHGSNTDGHLYIPKAIQNGAIGVVFSDVAMPLDVNTVSWIRVDDVRRTLARVADRYFQHPSAQLRITGVTGTNGKTTTCFFLRNIWEENGYPCGLLTTVKNIIGPDESEAKNTTEESLSLQMDLAAMRDKGIRHAVLEVSSHGLALGRVEGILFDTAVVTNVVAEHLEFHKTFENYFTSKKKLLS
ncbi:MAG: Mur ligase family protein, partial [Candidatus Atribacteria bacterium]|nr:Mur ligase family protein [Candidatus Atribacteria bacterium]